MAKRKKDAAAEPEITTKKLGEEVTLLRGLEHIPSFYTNVSTVRASPHDVQIIFSQQVERVEGKIAILPQVSIYMSTAHAKVLLDLLKKTIATEEP